MVEPVEEFEALVLHLMSAQHAYQVIVVQEFGHRVLAEHDRAASVFVNIEFVVGVALLVGCRVRPEQVAVYRTKSGRCRAALEIC